MQRNRKMVAGVLVCALVSSSLLVTQTDAGAATKGYTISKKAGTYQGSVKVKVKAKKGYTVYYTTGKKLSKSKKIKAKKSKSFTFKKTTTLRIYAVKASKKMTAKKLKAVKTKKMKTYRYKITAKSTNNDTTSGKTNGSTTSNSPMTSDNPNTSTPSGNPDTPSPSGNPDTPGPGGLPSVSPGSSQYEGDDALADYVEPARFSFAPEDTNTSAEGAIEITIPAEAPASKVTSDDGSYAISTKNKLTISKAGTYQISSEGDEIVSGSIEVDSGLGIVHLIFSDLHLKAAKDGDDATLSIKKDNTKAIITLEEESVNTLMNTGVEDVESGDIPAGILCKKTPLTINGTGELNIITPNANGIKCTDELKILDATISANGGDNVSTGNNGITGKKGLALKDASLMVHSNGDALKTTWDESDDAGIVDESEKASYGNMEIDRGWYKLISENGDGISVYRTLYLDPMWLDVTTKHADRTVTDSSCKGVKAGTTIYSPSTGELKTITVDTTETFKSDNVKADSNDPLADDAIHCDGYIKIDSGTFILSSGDDAIHSDKGLEINGGFVNVMESFEGLESGDITINGGSVTIKSRDDGINAGGGNDTPEGGVPGMGDDSFHK